jgi:hypothetical protein
MSEENTTQPVEQKAPELNINDLLSMRSLIEIVSQRGAFKANELTSVGVLFDKLNAFLEAAQAAQAAQQAPEAPQGE